MRMADTLAHYRPNSQYQQTLPHIRDMLGDNFPSPSRLGSVSSTSSSLQELRDTSPAASQLHTSGLFSGPPISCPRCATEGEHFSVRVGDACRRCYQVLTPHDDRRYSVPNIVNFRTGFTTESSLMDRSLIPSSNTQWSGNMPFRAPSRSSTLPRSRYRVQRRQPRIKDQRQKDKTKVEHSEKEKWRRDRQAVYTESKRRMQHILSWPGDLCGCTVKSCGPPKDLVESTASSKQGAKGNFPAGSGNYGRTAEKESKSSVQRLDVVWQFSMAVHYEPDKVATLIKAEAELVDEYLEKKEKIANGKDEKSKGLGARDIKSRAAYDLLEYMLEQCSDHGINLGEGSLTGQEKRRLKMGLEIGEEVGGVWGEGRGTPGSSGTFSEFDEEEDMLEGYGVSEGSVQDVEDDGLF